MDEKSYRFYQELQNLSLFALFLLNYKQVFLSRKCIMLKAKIANRGGV